MSSGASYELNASSFNTPSLVEALGHSIPPHNVTADLWVIGNNTLFHTQWVQCSLPYKRKLRLGTTLFILRSSTFCASEEEVCMDCHSCTWVSDDLQCNRRSPCHFFTRFVFYNTSGRGCIGGYLQLSPCRRQCFLWGYSRG